MFPFSASTASLNVSTILASTATEVFPSGGFDEFKTGPTVSATVNVAEEAPNAVSQLFSTVFPIAT